MKLLAERGQSLLEVAIAIGIAMIIITALTIVTLQGLRNSQFSQNQAQATGFAAEGRDKVTVIRDRDASIFSTTGTVLATYSQFWSTINCGLGCKFSLGALDDNGNCVIGGIPNPIPSPSTQNYNSPCLVYNGSTEKVINKFTRTVTIVDCKQPNATDRDCQGSLPRKKATILVSWSDASGPHQSYLVSLLQDLK